MNIVETQDEGEDPGFTLGDWCEIETEVNSVQLDGEIFLITLTKCDNTNIIRPFYVQIFC